MKTEEALKFLQNHKYMSSEEPQNIINGFDGVRKYFVSNPDERCIPLFMEAFGNHMGWGLYQLCDDVFNKYEPQKIVYNLKKYLISENIGTRWWAAHWAMEYPSPELTNQLIDISNSEVDVDAHYFALAALGEILNGNNNQVIFKFLQHRKASEEDAEIQELLTEYV